MHLWHAKWRKIWNASRICVSSLRRGHANLLCIVPILVYVRPKHVQLSTVSMLYIYQNQIVVRKSRFAHLHTKVYLSMRTSSVVISDRTEQLHVHFTGRIHFPQEDSLSHDCGMHSWTWVHSFDNVFYWLLPLWTITIFNVPLINVLNTYLKSIATGALVWSYRTWLIRLN